MPAGVKDQRIVDLRSGARPGVPAAARSERLVNRILADANAETPRDSLEQAAFLLNVYDELWDRILAMVEAAPDPTG